jgi:hypothetical protein
VKTSWLSYFEDPEPWLALRSSTSWSNNAGLPCHTRFASSTANCCFVNRRKLVPSHLVLFAVEGGGNWYCLDRGDESVWYADMEEDSRSKRG